MSKQDIYLSEESLSILEKHEVKNIDDFVSNLIYEANVVKTQKAVQSENLDPKTIRIIKKWELISLHALFKL